MFLFLFLFKDCSSSGLSLVLKRWATKKTAGSTKNGRDSKPKNLGVKKFGGEVTCYHNELIRDAENQISMCVCVFGFAECDTGKHNSPSTWNSVSSGRLCRDREGPYSVCVEGRTSQVREKQDHWAEVDSC